MRGVIFREKSGLFKTVTKTIVFDTLIVSTLLRGLRSNGTETYDNGINMLYLKCFYLGLTLSGTKTYVKV
uniref:Uncharacterized protein n=1 Tax=Leclercia adecarboxylata TaxID=83655 RepID=A0A6H1PRZ2_9ENTR|nr:hypothetical protein [Leclercia adecarboxylata]